MEVTCNRVEQLLIVHNPFILLIFNLLSYRVQLILYCLVKVLCLGVDPQVELQNFLGHISLHSVTLSFKADELHIEDLTLKFPLTLSDSLLILLRPFELLLHRVSHHAERVLALFRKVIGLASIVSEVPKKLWLPL